MYKTFSFTYVDWYVLSLFNYITQPFYSFFRCFSDIFNKHKHFRFSSTSVLLIMLSPVLLQLFSLDLHLLCLFLCLLLITEFFELLSRAQSSRADDQRGLLRKEDLVLPDFLRLNPEPSTPPSCSTPTSQKHGHGSLQAPTITPNGHNPKAGDETDRLAPPLSPILRPQVPPGPDGEGLCDLTLVGEGEISSPNSTLLPPVPTCSPPHDANSTSPSPPSTHRNPSSGISPG